MEKVVDKAKEVSASVVLINDKLNFKGQSPLSSSVWLVITGNYCQCDRLSGYLDMVEAGGEDRVIFIFINLGN
jgi:hypothetical protein